MQQMASGMTICLIFVDVIRMMLFIGGVHDDNDKG